MGIIQFITEVTSMTKAEAWHWMMDDCDGSNPYQYNETPKPQTIYSLDELVPFVGPPHPYLLDRGIPVDNIVKHVIGYDSATDCIVIPVWWQGDLVGADTTSGRCQHHRQQAEVHVQSRHEAWPCALQPRRLASRLVHGCSRVALTLVAKSHLDFNFVATMGGPTRGQMEIMREIEQAEGSIILAYDNDPAGWNDTVIVGNFLGGDADVYVALNEIEVDEMTDADLYEVLEDPMPYGEWLKPSTGTGSDGSGWCHPTISWHYGGRGKNREAQSGD